MVISSILSISLWVGYNPDWPTQDLTADLALRTFQPDDPDFAPWTRRENCTGQFVLYSFAPACAEQLQGSSTGLYIDRAWLYSTGHPSVTIAVIGDGVPLAHPELASKIKLNEGELPLLDRNGDGVVTVHDFTSATATQTPSIDLVTHPRLRDRTDRGDTNNNGILDPEDILNVFADNVDDDNNGLTDDIAGWDFLESDPRPHPAAGSEGTTNHRATLEALAAAAQTNNGIGGSGACPHCTILPLRTGNYGLSSTPKLGLALAYAADKQSRIALLSTAAAGSTPFLSGVMRSIENTVITVISAGSSRYSSHIGFLDNLDNRSAVVVSSLGFDESPESAMSAADPLPCSRDPYSVEARTAGEQCPTITPAGSIAGVLGLMIDAQSRSSNLQRPPSELLNLLYATAEPNGRIHAERAVEAVINETPIAFAHWITPSFGAVVDPSPGELSVQFELSSTGSTSPIRWRIQLAAGLEPREFKTIAEGDDSTPTARIEISGQLEDPARPPATLGDKAFWLRLLTDLPAEANPLPTTRDQLIFLDADLDRLPGFPMDLGAGALGGPRILDLNNDGIAEIWVALLDGRIIEIGPRGSINQTWSAHPYPLPPHFPLAVDIEAPFFPRLSAPTMMVIDGQQALGSVDADGALTIVMPSREAPLLVDSEFGDRGRRLTEDHPIGVISPALARPTFNANDNYFWFNRERVQSNTSLSWVLSAPPQAFALQYDFGPPLLWTVVNDQLINSMLFSTIIPDARPPAMDLGRLRLSASPIVSVTDRREHIFVPNQLGLWAWDGQNFSQIQGPTTGRMASHGPISASAQDVLFWWDTDTHLAPQPTSSNQTRVLDGTDTLDPVLFEIVVGDVDGASEEWIFAGDSGRLFALSENGKQALGWPKLTGQPIWSPPAFGDVDGDGTLELAAITRNGTLFLWRTRGRIDNVQWPSERHDPAATANTQTNRLMNTDSSMGCQNLPLKTLPFDVFLWWLGIGYWGLTKRRTQRPQYSKS